MPSFSSPSSVRVASQDHILRLKITHNLVYGSPSDVVHSVRRRLPKELDVLWLSDIAIVLSGSLDGRESSQNAIARSGLARHLQAQLRSNADQLGLNNVSSLFVDDADGRAKLTLTPSRPLPRVSRPHANLVSLHLAYIWETAAGRDNNDDDSYGVVGEVDLFSPALLLPAEALLNRVIEQFLAYHVVRRYPLIFGPWCKRLDLEAQYFTSIGQSIVQIMGRSEHGWFVSKCKRLLKIARRQHKFVIQACTTALCDFIEDPEETDSSICTPPVLTDEQVLCQSLEQLFRVGVPQRRFKPAARPQFVSLPLGEDDDSLLLPIPDKATVDVDEWTEIATSDVFDHSDANMFAREDGPEDEMWHLDAGQAECEFDTQSDKSLINASISFTGSLAACDFAPCGQRVDHDPDSEFVLLEDAEELMLLADVIQSDHDVDFERLDSCSEGGEEEYDTPGGAESGRGVV